MINWFRDTFTALPVQRGWIGLVLAVILVVGYVDKANAGDLWLEVNGLSHHSESDYHDGYERQYGELKDLVGHPDCCHANEDYTKLYVNKEKRRAYNGTNYGIGAMYEIDDHLGVKGGFYDNSYDKWSVYGGVNVRWEIPVGKFKVIPNTTVGFVTGYDDTPEQASKFQMMALPGVAFGNDKYRLNVGYIPGKMIFGDDSVDVITAQLQIKVW